MTLSFYLMVFILAFSTLTFSALDPKSYQSIIDSGISLTLNQQYDEAITLFKTASSKDNKNPLFDFYLMLTYEAMMVDYETTEWEKQFDSLCIRAEEGFKALEKKEPENAWVPYFLGSLQVTRGAHELRFSHYLNFTRSILNGVKLLKTSVKLDSTLNDAYLYIGLFQFARSKLVSWIPMFDDDRETAINIIEKAANGSDFSREFSTEVLIGLYGHTGEMDKAFALADSFKHKYPQNRAVYWIVGNACFAQKRYTEAEKEFLALKPMIEQGIPKKYLYNLIAVDALLSEIAFKTGRYDESLELCRNIQLVNTTDKRILELKQMARRLALKCEKKLKSKKGAS